MANYNVICAAIDGAYVDATSPGTNFYNSTEWRLKNDRYETLIKFDNSGMQNYRKKKIASLQMLLRISMSWGDHSGFTLSLLKSAFSGGSVTYNTMPENDWMLSSFKGNGTYEVYFFNLEYYQSGQVGLGGVAAIRSFFDQMPIGFRLANLVPTADKVNVDDRFRSMLTTDTYPPRVSFGFEDWNPILTARFPLSNAFVNYAIANTFSVGFDAFQSIDYPTVTTATYEIKDLTTSAVTSYNASMAVNLRGRTYIDIPIAANTFVTGKDYQWRAKLVTDDGATSFSEWANFTTKDVTPGLPTIISPQSKYLDGASAIALTWQHNINTGSVQHAYDLDYKQAGSWVSLAVHTVSAVQSFTVPANTFTAGQMYWRARTYNTDNVAGDYGTSAANIVQAKPVTPIIQSITVAPRSTISWQSVGQQAYELTVKDLSGALILDTGEAYGTAKSVTIDDFLANGNYTFNLTIQNGQGIWSDHAIQTVRIFNSPPPGDDVLTATSQFGAVKLDLILPEAKGADYIGETYVGESYLAHQPYYAAGTRYVLRDGIVIAKIAGTSYTDYTAYKEHQYKIRIVTSAGNYFDTNVVTASPTINYACISKFASPQDMLTLKFNEGSKPVLDHQLSKAINSHYFAGRTLAVQDVTEHHDSTWNYTYSFSAQANYKILEQLFLDGETVIFRDSRGYKAIGTIGSLKQVPNYDRNIASFSISETGASEVIAYD